MRRESACESRPPNCLVEEVVVDCHRGTMAPIGIINVIIFMININTTGDIRVARQVRTSCTHSLTLTRSAAAETAVAVAEKNS